MKGANYESDSLLMHFWVHFWYREHRALDALSVGRVNRCGRVGSSYVAVVAGMPHRSGPMRLGCFAGLENEIGKHPAQAPANKSTATSSNPVGVCKENRCK